MNTKTPGQNRLKQNKDYIGTEHLKTLRFEYRGLTLDLYDVGSCKMVTRCAPVSELNPD